MSKYKSFANPGNFSDFQINVPDLSSKIEADTAKKVAGLKEAENFRKGNEALYLEVQEYVQGQEQLTRERNFKLQNQERQSYKDALKRDYDIEMRNMLTQRKQEEAQLQQLGALSKSAFQLFGQIKKQKDEAQRLAAYDVYMRTGATYNDALAIQKLDDNLTRQEFGATKAVQEMIGDNGDPSLIDGLFQIYKNRNSKIWIEHKAALSNATVDYSTFLDQSLQQDMQENGGQLPDIEVSISKATREFIKQRFEPAKIRPEVLAQAGVYKTLQDANNAARIRLQREQRDFNKKELKQDMMTNFGQVFRQDGIVGMLQFNSENRTTQSREAMLEAATNLMRGDGPGSMSVKQAIALLYTPGGGPNGQSIKEAYGATPAVADLEKAIDAKERRQSVAFDQQEKQFKRDVENQIKERYNQAIADDDFSDQEFLDLENFALDIGGPGYNSNFINSIRNTTTVAQQAAESELKANRLQLYGDLTVDYVKNKMVFTRDAAGVASQQKFLSLAQSNERLKYSEPYKQRLEALKSVVQTEDPRVKINFKNENNIFSVNRAYDELRRVFKEKFNTLQMGENPPSEAEALDQAYSYAITEWKKLEIDGQGEYIKFKPKTDVETKQQQALRSGQMAQSKIVKILGSKTGVERNEALVSAIGPETLKETVVMLESNLPITSMPPAIIYIAEQMNSTPIDVIASLAPIVGKKVDINEDVRKVFKPKFRRARNVQRTPERVGRANIGDQNRGASSVLRPSIVQYVSGDPAIKGRTRGRIVYEPEGHGGENYHNHYQFETQEQAAKAKRIFDADPKCIVTSYWREQDTDSAHSLGLAVDVAPGPNLPRTEEAEMKWSAYCNSLIGFDPNG